MKDIHLYNKYHLGDQLYHIHFISKYVKEFPEFRFFNYMLPEFINESNLHRHPGTESNIINLPLDKAPAYAEDYWINRENYYNLRIHNGMYYGCLNFDIFYIDFYKYLMYKISLPIPKWTIEDAMFDHPIIINDNDNQNLEFDYLIVNSKTRSGQWPYDPQAFDTLIMNLKNYGYSVATTLKSSVDDVPSTMEDFNLNLLQLGNFASGCKYVIGNHTAPWLFTFNKKSMQNLKLLICMQNQGLSYSHPKVFPVRYSIKEVYSILENEKLYK